MKKHENMIFLGEFFCDKYFVNTGVIFFFVANDWWPGKNRYR